MSLTSWFIAGPPKCLLEFTKFGPGGSDVSQLWNINGYCSGGPIEIVTKSDANNLADALEKELIWRKLDRTTISISGIKEILDICRNGAFEII